MESKPKILVVEDDTFLGDVLYSKLMRAGYDVTLARDGKEGFEAIASVKPDIVLLDIILPHMNGYEILESKQADPAIAGIPVIVISNSGQPVEIRRIIELGAKDYIIKAQFNPDDVIEKVKTYLHGTPSEAAGAVDITGKKVLWVEDDPFLCEIIARKCKAASFELTMVNDGEHAIDALQEMMPDLIVLDVILPGMDGFEVLSRVKADQRTKAVPVVLLSNLGQQSDIDRAKELGAERFIVKAMLTLTEIIEELKKVLAKKR
jgi:CheY-like chemotaxis protein